MTSKDSSKGSAQAAGPQVNDQSLAQAIRDSDDFGHEMRIRTLLKTQGANVTHGWWYTDPVTGKNRQFDLRASLTHPDHPTYLQHIQFVLEGKNLSADNPLAVAGCCREARESFHDIITSDSHAGGCRPSVSRTTGQNYAYPAGEFVGKSVLGFEIKGGVIQAKSSKESEVYDRWSQALASADEVCKEAALAANSTPPERITRTVVLPGLVVPDRRLWIAEYNEVGELKLGYPRQADGATLFLNHEIVVKKNNLWMKLSHLHFWTLTGLGAFLADLTVNPSNWERWFPASVEPYRPPAH